MPDMHIPSSDVTLETSASTAALDEALAKAQGEIEVADKDKINPAFRSKYADLTSVWSACRPALAKNGIALTQWPLASSDNRLHIITRLAHKGEWMQARFSIPVDKANAHGVGSAITYAKRFTLSAVLGIVADDDDDGNAASHKPGAPGTAGAGGQFRPERRSPGMAQTESLKVDPADRDMVQGDGRSQYEADKAKKAAAKTGPLGGREATPEEARKLKIKNAVDKRVAFLKETKWTRDSLNQFWTDNEEWIDWMTDPNNKAMEEYDRFSKAYADAEVNLPAAEAA